MLYLDNASTTRVRSEVREAMLPFLTDVLGNPSSTHQLGRVVRAAIERAREQVSNLLQVPAQDLIFTSGGTEANHSALFGLFLAAGGRRHLVTTAVEHHAILDTVHFLKTFGIEATIIEPDASGRIHVEDVLDAVRDDTFCVSVMKVNNELGTVQPVEDLARELKARYPSVSFHTDFVQALTNFRLPIQGSGIDSASVSAHKIHGPKGVGALYIRKGTPWKSVLHGGSQEQKRRAGTENVAGIVGFGAAAQWLSLAWDNHIEHIRALRDTFWQGIEHIEGIRRNSPPDAVPTILNVAFSGVKAESLLMRLDLEGVAASAGSACRAGSLDPSHVLIACGQDERLVREAVRFSFSDDNTQEEIREAIRVVSQCVDALRTRKRS